MTSVSQRIEDRAMPARRERAAPQAGGRGVVPILRRAQTVVAVWSERLRSRRALRELDDDALKDIGLDQSAARKEALKPFWRR